MACLLCSTVIVCALCSVLTFVTLEGQASEIPRASESINVYKVTFEHDSCSASCRTITGRTWLLQFRRSLTLPVAIRNHFLADLRQFLPLPLNWVSFPPQGTSKGEAIALKYIFKELRTCRIWTYQDTGFCQSEISLVFYEHLTWLHKRKCNSQEFLTNEFSMVYFDACCQFLSGLWHFLSTTGRRRGVLKQPKMVVSHLAMVSNDMRMRCSTAAPSYICNVPVACNAQYIILYQATS